MQSSTDNNERERSGAAAATAKEFPDNQKANNLDQSGNISDSSTGSESSTGSSGGTPFRMEVKQIKHRKRKRKYAAPAAVNADDVLGGGEDEERYPATTTTTNSSQKQQHRQHSVVQPEKPSSQQQQSSAAARTGSPSAEDTNTKTNKQESTRSGTGASSPAKKDKVQQPDGWRVKLYRLNGDGSWDDCGTGRVLCLYRPAMAKAKASSPTPRSAAAADDDDNDNDDESNPNSSSSPPHSAALDSWICQELGEPTICMHAEHVSESTQPKILLRTRILLRDAYQRQGDNIITWCEPYYENNSSNSIHNNNNGNFNHSSNDNNNGKNGGGVDLALSFQDNAGCLDIWRQITHVQRRAAELYRTHQQQQPTAQSSSQSQQQSGENQQQGHSDGDENNNNQTQNSAMHHADSDSSPSHGTITDMAQKVAAEHHAELERQQQHQTWVSMAETVQRNSQYGAYADGEDGQQHLNKKSQQQQQQQQQQQHNSQHQAHHHGQVTNTTNSPNRQRQQHPGDSQQQQQQQHIQFVSAEDGGGELSQYGNSGASSPSHQFDQQGLSNNQGNNILQLQLPNPPTLSNLEEIADTIARNQHIQYRDSLTMFISQNECAYLKALLSLFPSAEDRGDYGSLATLAACVKTILLLNDPSMIELIVADEVIFEEVCATLEYDPDLRDKANHRWFLRERARFRTVVLMEDDELVAAIHRAFRVNYLRDTLLRPTMDESSLSTLSSLQTFTHADVVKGVTISPPSPQIHSSSASSTEGGHGHHHEHGNLHHDEGKDESERDSYLVRVIRMLGVELHALCHMEWAELEAQPSAPRFSGIEELPGDPSTVVTSGKYPESEKMSATWKQHLAPQDGSLASRRIRRRGCLTFLRELFNMVRISLQQSDKDNFFSVIVSMEIDVISGDPEKCGKISDNESQTSKIVEVGSVAASEKSERFDDKGDANLSQHMGLEFMPLSSPVNLLSLLGTVLSDPNTDVTEKGLVLEIIAGVAMHDPSLVRRHCLEFHSSERNNNSPQDRDVSGLGRPEANEKKQVIFLCPPNDLLAALLFLLDVETDAGILLQVSEIMRIILDTDMMGEHGPMGGGFVEDAEHGVIADEAEGLPPGGAGGIQSQPHEQHNQTINGGSTATTTEQKQFLSMFYEHFIDWVVAPFQFTILHPMRRVPDSVLISPSESPLLMQMMRAFKNGVTRDDGLFRIIPKSAIRISFAVELLSFCVRAHLYRMKIFLLKSSVLSNAMKFLKPQGGMECTSGDRSLKLAALRFMRAILSVNDEFYHRHIIHHDLFAPIFEAFRANPVGDNLVSSAIVEMCDFIHNEGIMTLMEYIVTKHLSPESGSSGPSLEDVSSPYVSTLTALRKTYEQNLKAAKQQQQLQQQGKDGAAPESPAQTSGNSRYFTNNVVSQGHRVLSGKALEEQRKFHEEHEEESYFEADDDDGQPEPLPTITAVPPGVDEVAAQEHGEGDLHRTARVFSLAQSPLMNHMDESESKETQRHDQNVACGSSEAAAEPMDIQEER